MKSKIFLIIIILLIYSCEDDSLINKAENNISLYNEAQGISNVGTEHNSIVNEIIKDTTHSISDTSEAERLFQNCISEAISLNNNYDSVSIYNYGVDVMHYIAGHEYDTILVNYYENNLPSIIPHLSVEEKELIEDVHDFIWYTDFSNLTTTQVYDSIINKANEFIVEYDAIDWSSVSSSSYMRGEGAGGFIYVMKASAENWKANPPDIDKPESIIQNDAGGYIMGWIGAVVYEAYTTGGLDISNQDTRIGAGLGVAAGASGLTALKKLGSIFGL